MVQFNYWLSRIKTKNKIELNNLVDSGLLIVN